MRDHLRHLIAPVAVVAVLALAPAAGASPTDVLRACLNEQSLDRFSDADKRGALNQLAADQDEYSDCRSVIGASIGSGNASAKASTAGVSAGVGTSPRQARKAQAEKQRRLREVRRKRARKARERELGPRTVDPRDAGVFKAASTANGMPLPLVLAVVALALLTLTGGLLVLSRRNPRVAGVLRRVPLPRFRR